jgi:rhodanese-related sulfurtransferase
LTDEIQPQEVRSRLKAGDDLCLLDVREPAEVAEWAFPGAVNIPLDELAGRASELPQDRQIVVVCHAGIRSAVAADALASRGWSAVSMAGGAIAWIASTPQTNPG